MRKSMHVHMHSSHPFLLETTFSFESAILTCLFSRYYLCQFFLILTPSCWSIPRLLVNPKILVPHTFDQFLHFNSRLIFLKLHNLLNLNYLKPPRNPCYCEINIRSPNKIPSSLSCPNLNFHFPQIPCVPTTVSSHGAHLLLLLFFCFYCCLSFFYSSSLLVQLTYNYKVHLKYCAVLNN